MICREARNAQPPGRDGLLDWLDAARRARHRRASTPGARPPPARARRHARRLRHRRHGRRRTRPRAIAAPGADGRPTSRPRVCAPTPAAGRHDAARPASTLLDYGIKDSIARLARRGRRRRDVVPHDATAADVAATRSRRRVALERPRRPGAMDEHVASVARCSIGDAAAVRHLPRAPAARPRARRRDVQAAASATAAATTRCSSWRPAACRSPARTTASRSTAPSGDEPRRRHPRQPQRRHGRGHPRPASRRVQRAVPSRGAPGPHDAAILVRLRRDRRRAREARPADAAARRPEDDLLIGSGPIVIGQACEFDYSGTQACRVLRAGGLPRRPRQLEPGDDHDRPGLADRDLHRAARRSRASPTFFERERPDALLPTLGGQTALNPAMELAERGRARRARHRADRRQRSRPSPTAEDRERFKLAMIEIGLACRASGSPTPSTRPSARSRRQSACRSSSGPAFILGGQGAGIAHDAEESASIAAAALDASPIGEILIEESLARLEGVRARGHPRPRATTASSSARSRTSTRWACTPATRSPSRRRRR